MKIEFPKKPTPQIIKDLNGVLDKRAFPQTISLSHESNDLVVKISKMGTSTLIFTRTDAKKRAEFSLTSENIAFAHKPFYGQFKDELLSVVEEAGGKVTE